MSNPLSYILLMSASDIDSTNFHIFEYYAKKMADVTIPTDVFAEFSIILLITYVIRLLIIHNMEKERKDKSSDIYIIAHVVTEFLIAYSISIFIVKCTDAKPDNPIVNMIIAPIVGFISSVVIDAKVIIPLSGENNDGTMSILSSRRKKENKKSSPGEGAHSVNITVNNNSGEDNNTDNKSNMLFDPENLLSLEDINTDNFNKKVFDSITTITNGMNKNAKDIEKANKKIAELDEYIGKIKATVINEKRLELKSMIYDCLNHGFVTPKENDKITTKSTKKKNALFSWKTFVKNEKEVVKSAYSEFEDVKKQLTIRNNVIIAVSEGIRTEDRGFV